MLGQVSSVGRHPVETVALHGEVAVCSVVLRVGAESWFASRVRNSRLHSAYWACVHSMETMARCWGDTRLPLSVSLSDFLFLSPSYSLADSLSLSPLICLWLFHAVLRGSFQEKTRERLSVMAMQIVCSFRNGHVEHRGGGRDPG